MKSLVIHEIFFEAISRAEKIAAKNSSLPVLKCVLLESTKNEFIIRSTNLDLGIEIRIPATGTEDGLVAVPADALSSFLSIKPTHNKITLEGDENQLLLTSTHGKAKLRVYPHDDFPKLPKIKDGTVVKIETDHLIKGLKSVWYSASVSSMKPELSSIFISSINGELTFAATDSFRLAEKKISTKDTDEFNSLLIPLKNIPEIIRNLEKIGPGKNIELVFSNNQLSFEGEGTYITSRIVDSTFPDYKQIIPKEYISEAVVLKQDLIETCKLSNVFINRFNQILMSIEPGKKKFILETSNPDRGESTVPLDAALTGEDLHIGFNHKYLTDCLSSIHTDSVALRFGGIGRPLVISGIGDGTFTYLVMPMNK